MGISKWLWLCLVFLVLPVASTGFASEGTRLPCEVLEVSPDFKNPSGQLSGVGYLLVRHANASDRERFSKWLKTHSGTEVGFVVQGREYKGILSRLANCFGRGLLIYKNQITAKKRDIIDLILPVSP
jgi:hypothetical protein